MLFTFFRFTSWDSRDNSPFSSIACFCHRSSELSLEKWERSTCSLTHEQLCLLTFSLDPTSLKLEIDFSTEYPASIRHKGLQLHSSLHYTSHTVVTVGNIASSSSNKSFFLLRTWAVMASPLTTCVRLPAKAKIPGMIEEPFMLSDVLEC